jgi:hypothetical protein
VSRDRRFDKSQVIEYDYLAPDSVNEIFGALDLMYRFIAMAHAKKSRRNMPENSLVRVGRRLVEEEPAATDQLEILAEGFENSERPVQLIKVREGCETFRDMIIYYGMSRLLWFIEEKKIGSWQKLRLALPTSARRDPWKNIGGQLMPAQHIRTLTGQVRSGKIKSWDEVHDFYARRGRLYAMDKFRHGWASLLEILQIRPAGFTKKRFFQLLDQVVSIREKMVASIYESRQKDYQNEFRKMVYDTPAEMEKVLGKLDENTFIMEQRSDLDAFRERISALRRWS